MQKYTKNPTYANLRGIFLKKEIVCMLIELFEHRIIDEVNLGIFLVVVAKVHVKRFLVRIHDRIRILP